MFAQSELPLKRFWEHQLFETDSEATIDWNEPQRQAALREVVSTYPADWEGWGVVTQVVPEPVLRPLLAQRTRREPLPVYDTELEPDRPWFGGNGRWTWILVLVAIKAALFSMSSFKSIPEPPSRSGPPPLPSYPELRDRDNSPAATAQRRLDELRRKQDGDAKLPSGPSDPFPGLGPMMQDRRPVPRAEGDTADKRFRLD